MAKKKQHRIKRVKFGLGLLVLLLVPIALMSSFMNKVFQVFYLKDIGWNVQSISPISTFFIFIGSVAYLGISFIERSHWFHKALGGMGIVYALFIFILIIFM